MPRMGQRFFVPASGAAISPKIMSLDRPGMRVAGEQFIGTLAGLTHGLVLEGGEGSKLLLLPNAEVEVDREEDGKRLKGHQRTRMLLGSASSLGSPECFAFPVRENLREIQPPSSRVAALLLARLHMATSGVVPDPFTRDSSFRTEGGLTGLSLGVQQLLSPRCWSNAPLDSETTRQYLGILALCPQRQLMAEVKWGDLSLAEVEKVRWPEGPPAAAASDGVVMRVAQLVEDRTRLAPLHFPGCEWENGKRDAAEARRCVARLSVPSSQGILGILQGSELGPKNASRALAHRVASKGKTQTLPLQQRLFLSARAYVSSRDHLSPHSRLSEETEQRSGLDCNATVSVVGPLIHAHVSRMECTVTPSEAGWSVWKTWEDPFIVALRSQPLPQLDEHPVPWQDLCQDMIDHVQYMHAPQTDKLIGKGIRDWERLSPSEDFLSILKFAIQSGDDAALGWKPSLRTEFAFLLATLAAAEPLRGVKQPPSAVNGTLTEWENWQAKAHDEASYGSGWKPALFSTAHRYARHFKDLIFPGPRTSAAAQANAALGRRAAAQVRSGFEADPSQFFVRPRYESFDAPGLIQRLIDDGCRRDGVRDFKLTPLEQSLVDDGRTTVQHQYERVRSHEVKKVVDVIVKKFYEEEREANFGVQNLMGQSLRVLDAKKSAEVCKKQMQAWRRNRTLHQFLAKLCEKLMKCEEYACFADRGDDEEEGVEDEPMPQVKLEEGVEAPAAAAAAPVDRKANCLKYPGHDPISFRHLSVPDVFLHDAVRWDVARQPAALAATAESLAETTSMWKEVQRTGRIRDDNDVEIRLLPKVAGLRPPRGSRLSVGGSVASRKGVVEGDDGDSDREETEDEKEEEGSAEEDDDPVKKHIVQRLHRSLVEAHKTGDMALRDAEELHRKPLGLPELNDLVTFYTSRRPIFESRLQQVREELQRLLAPHFNSLPGSGGGGALLSKILQDSDMWPARSPRLLLPFMDPKRIPPQAHDNDRARLRHPVDGLLGCLCGEAMVAPRLAAMGVLFVHLQQIQRLVAPLQRLVEDSRKKETALCIPMPLCKEICAEPYEAFSPKHWPCWVLLEVDANLTIRPYQPDFARHTLEPSKNLNAISELGVGLGKTAVVTPMVATAIADGSVSEGPPREPRLSEVLVLAPLLKGNVEDLAFRLGGLLNRRVHTLSFKRDRALTPKLLDQLLKSLEECKDRRGVLVWLPDAKQSLLLRQQEMADSDQPIGAGKEKRSPEYRLELVKRLGRINAFFARYGRGLIDEADSVLHYKNQLVYAVGKQNPLEGGELRRLVPFAVLRLLTDVAPEALRRFPSALEIPHVQKWKAQKRRYKKELQATEENAGASSSSSGVQRAPEGDEDIEDEMDRSALPGSHMFFPVRLLRNASADSLGLTATPESRCVVFLMNTILRNIWAGDAAELRLPDVEERRRRWYNVYILQQWHDGNDLPTRHQDRLFEGAWDNENWMKFRNTDPSFQNFWIGKPGFETAPLHDVEARKKLWDKREKYISDISEAVELFWKIGRISCPEKTAVMALRGLFSGPQIFVHCLSERYRVNFGVDPRVEDVARRARVEIAHNETLRQMGMTKNLGPPMSVAEVVGREGKRLSAVPFRGKDKPADRTEFANPDVAVMFTLLSYFYQGLGEAEILEVLEDLQNTPNPDATWRFWLHSVRNPEKRRFHVSQALSVSAVALRMENLQNMRKKKEREQQLKEARKRGQQAAQQKKARKAEQRKVQANDAELRRMERAELAKVYKEKKNAAIQAKRKETIERKNMWQKLRGKKTALSGATPVERILKDRCVQLYDIPPSIIDRRSVNSDDAKQLKLLVAILSRHMDVIAFWLERRVFSFESKVFPARISASGWSLCPCPDARRLQMAVSLGDEFRLRKLPPPSTGDEATDLTNVKETFADLGDEGNRTVDGPAITGFSGTSETQLLLPGTAEQDDMPSLLGTVGVNLLRLVRRENFLYKALEPGMTGEELIKSIARLPPDNKFPMVILDGGALIVELGNEAAASLFLMETRANRRRLGGNARLPEAVVFFDKKDELVVKDARGRVSPLRLSPFFSCMRDALAFLDDSHTRGVDLPGLPEDAVAAYTLGKGVSLDKLLQGVGRMRLLGQGQSVRFLAAAEVDRHIREKLRSRVGGKGTMQELMESVVGKDLNDLIVQHQQKESARLSLCPIAVSSAANPDAMQVEAVAGHPTSMASRVTHFAASVVKKFGSLMPPQGDARFASAMPTRVPSASASEVAEESPEASGVPHAPGGEGGRRLGLGGTEGDGQAEIEGGWSVEEGEEGDRARVPDAMDDGEEGQNPEDEDEDVQEVEEAAFDAAMRAREAEKKAEPIDLDGEDEEALHPSLFDILDHALLESQAVIKNGVPSWLQQCASRMQTEVAQAEAAHVLAPGFGAGKDSSDEDSDGDGERKKKDSSGGRRPRRAAAAAAAARMQQGREAEDDEDSSEDDRDEEEEAGSEHEDGGERMRAVRKRRRAKEKERAEREGEMDRNIARLSCRVLATLGREREKVSLVEMYGHEGAEKIEFLQKYAEKKFRAVAENCEEKKGRMIQQEDNKGLDSDESPLTDVVCVRVKPYAKHVGKCLPKRKGQNAMNALALGDEQERELEQEVLPVKPEDPVEVIKCKEVPQGFTVHSALWDVLTDRFATVQEFLRDCVSLETSQYPVNRDRWPDLTVHKASLHSFAQVISGSRARLALNKVVLPLGDRQRDGFQPPIRYSPNYDGEAIYKAQTNKTPKVNEEEAPANGLQAQQEGRFMWATVVSRALRADGLVPSDEEEAARNVPVDVVLRSRHGRVQKVMLPPKTFGLDLYFTDDFRDVLDADEAAKLRASQVVGQQQAGTGLDLFLRTPKFVVSIREPNGQAALVCLGPHEAEILCQKTVHRELRLRKREHREARERADVGEGGGRLQVPRASMAVGGRGSMRGGPPPSTPLRDRPPKRSLDGQPEGGVKVPKSENDSHVRVKVKQEEGVPVAPSPPRQQNQQQPDHPVRQSARREGRTSRGLPSVLSSIHLLSPRKEPEQPSLFLDSRLALPPLKTEIALLPVEGPPGEGLLQRGEVEGMGGGGPGIAPSPMAGGMHRGSVLSTQRAFRRVSAGAGGFAFSVTDFWESTPANENLRRLLSTLLFLSGNLFFAHVKEEEEVCRLLSLLPKPFLPKFAEWRTAFDNSVSRGFFPPVAMSGGQTMWLDEKVVDAARSLAKRLDDEGRRCFFKTSPVPFVKALLTARRQINRLTDSHLGSLVESHSRTLGLPGAPPGEREEAERLERELEERKRKEKEEAERERQAAQQQQQQEQQGEGAAPAEA